MGMVFGCCSILESGCDGEMLDLLPCSDIYGYLPSIVGDVPSSRTRRMNFHFPCSITSTPILEQLATIDMGTFASLSQ
jgi:hypothetical protein